MAETSSMSTNEGKSHISTDDATRVNRLDMGRSILNTYWNYHKRGVNGINEIKTSAILDINRSISAILETKWDSEEIEKLKRKKHQSVPSGKAAYGMTTRSRGTRKTNNGEDTDASGLDSALQSLHL